ncbi:MAG TPA: hypothetical protein VGH20_05305 [Myxococcales bacterium]
MFRGLDGWFARLKPLVNARYRNAKGFVTALQTLLCAALVITLLIRVRRPVSPWRALILLYVFVFWTAPIALAGSVSLYRSEALLLPAALLVPSLPRRAQVAFVVASVAVSVPMARLFFAGILV